MSKNKEGGTEFSETIQPCASHAQDNALCCYERMIYTRIEQLPPQTHKNEPVQHVRYFAFSARNRCHAHPAGWPPTGPQTASGCGAGRSPAGTPRGRCPRWGHCRPAPPPSARRCGAPSAWRTATIPGAVPRWRTSPACSRRGEVTWKAVDPLFHQGGAVGYAMNVVGEEAF